MGSSIILTDAHSTRDCKSLFTMDIIKPIPSVDKGFFPLMCSDFISPDILTAPSSFQNENR